MGFKCEHNHISLKKLSLAILINVVLTLVQSITGLLSGSLSLIADAIHNFSDAISLVIAYIAERISHWPENTRMTYGYGRAQIIGAFINSISLIIVSFYLAYEVILRFINPEPIDGWIVVITGFIALVIDLATAKLTHSESHHNLNMKAAFIHNLSDAMASVVVIISGTLALLYDIYIFDLIASLLIAAFIFYQSIDLIKNCLQHLMQATPSDINFEILKKTILEFNEIKEIKSLHIWSMNEKQRSLEACLLLNATNINHQSLLKNIKIKLHQKFNLQNSTIEFSLE